ncbi:MAG: collagen-like triple helix repeat-containing protein [Alphaproteobacteria bacterium]
MNEILRELIKWLGGGGALALAAFLSTTAYQEGQLELEREARLGQLEIDKARYLRDFLGDYVEIATKGSLEERIRFVSYWTSLGVEKQIGVNFQGMKTALREEFEEADRFARQVAAISSEAGAAAPHPLPSPGEAGPAGPVGPAGPIGPVDPPSRPVVDPPKLTPIVVLPDKHARTVQTDQAAYFASRSQTVANLIPGAKQAPRLEREAFEALLAKDLVTAHQKFSEAERAWPTYHNVAELARITKDPPQFDALMEKVLRNYSWGMPPDILRRVKDTVGK